MDQSLEYMQIPLQGMHRISANTVRGKVNVCLFMTKERNSFIIVSNDPNTLVELEDECQTNLFIDMKKAMVFHGGNERYNVDSFILCNIGFKLFV